MKIILRADSGFCRDDLMSWCEDEKNRVDYVLGLAKNERLKKEITEEIKQAEAQFRETQQPARVFKEFRYETLTSWSRERRVIGKAEYLVVAMARSGACMIFRVSQTIFNSSLV